MPPCVKTSPDSRMGSSGAESARAGWQQQAGRHLLYEVAVNKAPALGAAVLVLEGAPLRVAEAAHALDHLPQAVLCVPGGNMSC